jgi:hypothetical protein
MTKAGFLVLCAAMCGCVSAQFSKTAGYAPRQRALDAIELILFDFTARPHKNVGLVKVNAGDVVDSLLEMRRIAAQQGVHGVHQVRCILDPIALAYRPWGRPTGRKSHEKSGDCHGIAYVYTDEQ